MMISFLDNSLPACWISSSEIAAPNLLEKTAFQHHMRVKSYDDFEKYYSSEKLVNKSRGPTENSLTKIFAADKETANNVAKIKVVVRKRPLNKKEIAKKEEDIISIEHRSNSLTVHETKFKVDLTKYVEKHDFAFDAVLDERVSNEEVYSETVQPLVPLIFRKTKATCFAYGQTGSGKTFTMQPLPLKASQDILRLMHYNYYNQGFQLYFSFFEIYGGKLYDLLGDRRKLCMREDGKQQVCIVGLQEYRVSDVETIRDLIEKGAPQGVQAPLVQMKYHPDLMLFFNLLSRDQPMVVSQSLLGLSASYHLLILREVNQALSSLGLKIYDLLLSFSIHPSPITLATLIQELDASFPCVFSSCRDIWICI